MNKQSVFLGAGVVASLVLSFLAFSQIGNYTPTNSGDGLGSVRNVDTYPDGIKIGKGPVAVSWQTGTIGSGVNQASFQNKTGRVMCADLAVVRTTGTASSSYRITVGTSTSATVSDFAALTGDNRSIIDFSFATSTTATSSNSVHGVGAVAGVVCVNADEYYNIALRAGTSTTASAGCNGATCESATSTNRGFDIIYYLRYFGLP